LNLWDYCRTGTTGLIVFLLIPELSVFPVLHPYYSSDFGGVIVNLVWGECEESGSFDFTCPRLTSTQAFCDDFMVSEIEHVSF